MLRVYEVHRHSDYLRSILEEGSERVHRKKSAILFRRGDEAAGMFLILNGKVRLHDGFDSADCHSCGPGTLVGLLSALTLHDYCMTATVTEDAELSFLTAERLHSLLCQRPVLRSFLLSILKETRIQ